MHKITKEFLVTRIQIKSIAAILTCLMAWTYLIPRHTMYELCSIVGGFVGFFFIFLVPILLYFKSRSDTALLERRLNSQALKVVKTYNYPGSMKNNETHNNDSTLTGAEEHETNAAGLLLTILFCILGLGCAMLPVLSTLGLIGTDF